MKCPYCFHEDTKVIDKRDSDTTTRRRRECLECEKRFTTYERAEINLIIIKKDGRRESFSRDKLKAGITKACEKRPVAGEQIENIVDDIEARLRRFESTEIPSTVVGDLVMKKLKKADDVAYIRFASVYRSFDDVQAFEKEVKILKKQ